MFSGAFKWHLRNFILHLFLASKHTNNSYVLTLYPAALINSLNNSGRCFCRFLRIFCVQDHVISEQRYFIFIFIFTTCMPFISFSSLVGLIWTSCTTLNRNCESSHHFSQLWAGVGRTLNISTSSMRLAVGLL